MYFETTEIFIVCYIGNWNITSLFCKNKSLKILTSYDLQIFCYRLLNNMKVLKIHKVHSYLKLEFLELGFFRELQNSTGLQQGMHLFLKNNIKIEGFFVWLVLDPIKPVKYRVFIFKIVSHFTLHLPPCPKLNKKGTLLRGLLFLQGHKLLMLHQKLLLQKRTMGRINQK